MIRRVLERRAALRPQVLLLEDVIRSADSLAFVEYLLRAQGHSSCAVVLVLTARSEELAERPDEQALLAEMVEGPRARRLLLEPLRVGQRSAWCRQKQWALSQ